MKTKLLLFLILVLALSLRLPHLIDKEQGTDEDLSIEDAQLIKNSKAFMYLYTPIPYEVNPPFFFHLLTLGLMLYDSIITLKIIMVILGMLGIVAFFFLAKKLFNEKIALFSTFLYAINPMHLIYSQHIRSYILVFFLYALSLFFLYRFLFKKDSKSLFYLGILYVLSAYTHYHTMLFMAGGFVTVVAFWFFNREIKLKQYILFGLIIFLLAIPALLILRKQFLFFSSIGGTNVWPPLTPMLALYPFWKYSVMADVSTVLDKFPYLFVMFPVLVGVSFYSAYRLFKTSKEKFIFLMTNISVPFIIYTIAGFIWPIFSFRYITYLLLPSVLLYSYGLYSIKNKLLKSLLLLFLLIGWLIIIFYYYSITKMYVWPDYIAI